MYKFDFLDWIMAAESAKAINENPEILQGYVYLD